MMEKLWIHPFFAIAVEVMADRIDQERWAWIMWRKHSTIVSSHSGDLLRETLFSQLESEAFQVFPAWEAYLFHLQQTWL